MGKGAGAIAIVASVTAVFFLSLPTNVAADENCDREGVFQRTCAVSSSVGDGSVTLEGRQTTPGDGGSTATRTDDEDDDAHVRTGLPGFPEPTPPSNCVPGSCMYDGRGSWFIVTGPTPVTLADIAQFRPTPAVDHSQPNGWAIIGLDTNFYTTGDSIQTVDGTLLGQPATVRFTPARWWWTFSDGTTNTTSTGGAPWAGREQEFDPTPTSHVFRTRGTHTIELTVDYTAEYQYTTGSRARWKQIPGLVSIPTNTLTVTAGTAKTVLVAENCNQNPRGPGC